jgi:hypothetical protein
MKFLYLVVAVVLVTGCATNPNLVGLQGNSLDTRHGLQDRRAAKMHVRVAPSLPKDAQPMKDYSVERCHQFAQQEMPSNQVLTDDLVMLACAEGADGLTDLRFERESGLLKNCWSIARGTSLFFRRGN